MSEFYYKEIIETLIDKIEGLKAVGDELRVENNRLMAENIRLQQIINEREEGCK